MRDVYNGRMADTSSFDITSTIDFQEVDNALNQARLVIAARNKFTDGELCDHYRSPIGSRRDLSLFQVNFYGFLQEFILREICGCGGPD